MRKRICNEDLDRSFGIPSSSFFPLVHKYAQILMHPYPSIPLFMSMIP